MKSYKDIRVNILEQASNKSVVFTFGRFQPPTSGHQLLINKVIKEARKRRAEHRIYPSHSHDAKQNPLSHKDKVLYMRKMFPKANIIDDKKAVNPFNVLESLSKEGYKNVYFMVGGDRVSEFQKGMKKYVGKDGYDFDTFEVISAGHRDPDAEGVVGMSGSKMRKAVADDEFEQFLNGVPDKTSKRVSLGLFKAIRKGMGLKEEYISERVTDGWRPGAAGDLEHEFTPDNWYEDPISCIPADGGVFVCKYADGSETWHYPEDDDTGKVGPNQCPDEQWLGDDGLCHGDDGEVDRFGRRYDKYEELPWGDHDAKPWLETFNVRLADTNETRARGLMYEKSMSDDDGMLFVFEDENYHGIWMKNTYIPLDVVWINESGTIVDVQTMQPHDLNTHIPNEPAKFVLEVNAGTFSGEIGDTLAERTLLRKLKMDKFSRSERKRKKDNKKKIRKYNRMVGIPLAASYDAELNEGIRDFKVGDKVKWVGEDEYEGDIESKNLIGQIGIIKTIKKFGRFHKGDIKFRKKLVKGAVLELDVIKESVELDEWGTSYDQDAYYAANKKKWEKEANAKTRKQMNAAMKASKKKDNTAAVAKQVKQAVKKYTKGKVTVRSKGGKTRFIMLSADNIDNKLRKMMLDVVAPKAKANNPKDISYGNISSNIISASVDHWVKALGLKESIDDKFENMLTELSIQSRRKMARAAKRTAKRRAAKRKIKARRMKGAGDLKKKSQKTAIMGFRNKMLKGRSWAKLSHSEKENVTKRMKKKYSPARIAKVAAKLLPGIRKGERARIAALKGGKEKTDEQVQYLTEPQALENLVKKLQAEGMGKNKAYAIATAQLQKSGVLKKGTHNLKEVEEARNYRTEYDNYQGSQEQREKRSSRNKARRIMTAKGLCKMGDGNDVDHKDRNPLNNDFKNLRVQKKEKNRSFSRKVKNDKPLEDGTTRTAKYHKKMTPGQWVEQVQTDRVKEKHKKEKEKIQTRQDRELNIAKELDLTRKEKEKQREKDNFKRERNRQRG